MADNREQQLYSKGTGSFRHSFFQKKNIFMGVFSANCGAFFDQSDVLLKYIGNMKHLTNNAFLWHFSAIFWHGVFFFYMFYEWRFHWHFSHRLLYRT